MTIQALPRKVRGRPRHGRAKVLAAAGVAVLLLFVVELGLQLRSQLYTGQSIFVRWRSGSNFVKHPESGLLVLRPNSVIVGSRETMRSNSLGLRSPELPAAKTPGSLRVLMIGASGIMGAYAHDNEVTIPALLQRELSKTIPGRHIDVINGGIAGYTLRDQTRMLAWLAERLQPDLVLVQSGVNDFAGYCRSGAAAPRSDEAGLPLLAVPKWSVSMDLLRKNTGAVREWVTPPARLLDARKVDLTGYRDRLTGLIAAARERHLPLSLATNVRSYQRQQPPALQQRLSVTARYYNPCFDVEGLHALYERHNQVIEEIGAQFDVPVLDLAARVPGGDDYFVDSTHMNETGRRLVAGHWAQFVQAQGLLRALEAPL